MTTDTTYNGWTNYETWATNLWLTNEPGPSAALSEIASDTSITRSERGDTLRAFVEECYEIPTTGLAGDLVGAALQAVNWVEIIENHEEDEA